MLPKRPLFRAIKKLQNTNFQNFKPSHTSEAYWGANYHASLAIASVRETPDLSFKIQPPSEYDCSNRSRKPSAGEHKARCPHWA